MRDNETGALILKRASRAFLNRGWRFGPKWTKAQSREDEFG
jgi:hypothetical protein